MSDWQEASLADLADYINGRAIKPEECSTKEGIPVIRIKQINDPQSIEDRFCGEDLDEKNIARSGDLLFSWSATLKTILWQGPAGAINQHIFKVLPKDGTDKIFLHYLIDYSLPALTEESHGSTMKHIKKSALSAFHLQIPPLPEQKKIAEILSGIDLRIRLGEQKIAHLEILLKSLGDKFFGNQSQYETKTIGEIFEVSSGTTPSRSRQDYFCTNGGTPWVKTMDLNDNHIRTTDEQLTRTGILEGRARIFPAGTLLIAMYGGWNQIGRTGILAKHSSCNQAMSALLPTKEVSPEFLNLQLVIRRSYWRGVAASSRKDPNITKADVTNMPIAIPALNEQYEITNALDSVLQQKSSEYQYLETLNLLKSALASDLLSGRKRVIV